MQSFLNSNAWVPWFPNFSYMQITLWILTCLHHYLIIFFRSNKIFKLSEFSLIPNNVIRRCISILPPNTHEKYLDIELSKQKLLRQKSLGVHHSLEPPAMAAPIDSIGPLSQIPATWPHKDPLPSAPALTLLSCCFLAPVGFLGLWCCPRSSHSWWW